MLCYVGWVVDWYVGRVVVGTVGGWDRCIVRQG